MSNQPTPPKKNPYSTVSASKRRAQRQAQLAQQSSARRQLSITGTDPQERDRLAQQRERSAVVAKKIQLAGSDLTAQLLEHPTKFVSEDELRTAYTYVLRDLRSMGVLAAGLIILLVVLAQVLPR
ncbi:MAG: hypothetical protein SGI73_16390 [Chloroflexota bacterium]|nr:hypothetical protein [Chloroflexota bacterium]